MALNVTRPSRFKSYGVHATTDDTTVVAYTCPPNTVAYMSLLFLSNGTANATDVSAVWYDDSENDETVIVGGKNFTAGEFLQFSGAFIVLEPGDEMRVTPSNTGGGANPDIGVITTVEEVFLPNG